MRHVRRISVAPGAAPLLAQTEDPWQMFFMAVYQATLQFIRAKIAELSTG